MHKSTFDEEQLEKLLKNMPKVKDTQDPELIFAKISSRLESEIPEKKNSKHQKTTRKMTWVLPTLASLAAIVIIALVAPSFLYKQESTIEDATKESREEKAIIDGQKEQEENFIMMAEEGPMARMAPVAQTHLITELPEDQEYITVAIPDMNAQFVVPISFIVPKDGEMTNLERMETIEEHLHEEEWGLSSYILEGVKFSEEITGNGVNKLMIDVPVNHPYGNGSAMEVIFLSSVKEMAKQLGFSVVEFRTDHKPGIMLGNYGELKALDLKKENSKGLYYIFQPNGLIQKYLVPFTKEVEFSQALEAMKLPVEIDLQQVKPSIPEYITFQKINLDENANLAVIEFTENTVLSNDENNLLMIEAILLTAKEYGAQSVQFKNANTEFVGPYNLLEPIKVPVAVNPMPY